MEGAMVWDCRKARRPARGSALRQAESWVSNLPAGQVDRTRTSDNSGAVPERRILQPPSDIHASFSVEGYMMVG